MWLIQSINCVFITFIMFMNLSGSVQVLIFTCQNYVILPRDQRHRWFFWRHFHARGATRWRVSAVHFSSWNETKSWTKVMLFRPPEQYLTIETVRFDWASVIDRCSSDNHKIRTRWFMNVELSCRCFQSNLVNLLAHQATILGAYFSPLNWFAKIITSILVLIRNILLFWYNLLL